MAYDIPTRFHNVAAVAMETKKGDLKHFWIPFIKLHETL
jgi:hypothetical protein